MVFGLSRSTQRAIVFAVAIVFATCGSLLAADGFRIETKIFAGDEEEPVSKTTTLFLDGVVYDFLEKPEQTAVFRKPTGGNVGRFILLNDKERIQTTVTTEDLAGAMSKLKDWASRQTNPFLKFSANPQFDETFDRESGKLVLTSHLETYTVATEPAQHQDSLAEYGGFLDWYTQLNTLLTAGRCPPEPRLKLNDALMRHKALPKTVELKRDGEDPLRAEHVFTWRLSQDDLQRIEDVRESLTKNRDVPNQEFLSLSAPKSTAR